MTYEGVRPGIFVERVNRFIAIVDVEGEERQCHVRNTGRLRELLLPGARVLVQPSANPARKTAFSLISVYKGERLVNIDSLAPNRLFAEHAPALWPGARLYPERSWGSSRFDFFVENYGGEKGSFVEVKGVTLEQEGVARFPDAPTQRGVRHVQELMACLEEGYGAAIGFVIQMEGVHCFRPNDDTHPEFGAALRKAAGQGVELLAFCCSVQPGEVHISGALPVEL